MVSSESAKQFLASSWLPEMDHVSREALLTVLQEHRAEPGMVLLERGKANHHVGFLLEGTLQVTRPNLRQEAAVISMIEAPSMFGLTSFFRPNPPDFNLKATSLVRYLTLDHKSHERLRKEQPLAAEQLAVSAIHVLADRLDSLDRRITEDLADHPDDHPKVTEWSVFRTRLFEETAL